MIDDNNNIELAPGWGKVSAGIAMRDGAQLMTDIWSAAPTDCLPVILERTPYGRDRTDQAEQSAEQAKPKTRKEVASDYLKSGFIYIVQDCRGTGQSEGKFKKYVQEKNDGLDMINWIKSQPWCDGRVGMAGFSYGAACQLPVIAGTPDALTAAVLDCGGFSNALANGIRQGGALLLKQATWAFAQAQRDATAAGDDEAAAYLEKQNLADWLKKGPWVKGHTPLEKAPKHQENLEELWQNATQSKFWQRDGLRTDADALAQTETAVLVVTSWHDTSLRSAIDNFAALNGNAATCPKPQLIIGPWSHGDRWSSAAGEVDFGLNALPENAFGMSVPELRTKFLFDSFSSRPQNEQDDQPNRVSWFEIASPKSAVEQAGEDWQMTGSWREAETWPPKKSQTESWAICRAGLDKNADRDEVDGLVAQLQFDPENPVPTLGGAINSGGDVMPGGMFEQSRICVRNDTSYLRAPVFEHDCAYAGPVRVSVGVQTDLPDFDIAAKLILECAQGNKFNLSDGLCRARFRKGFDKERLVSAGKPVQIDVELNPAAFRVRKGQRLGLLIAGSNFPCFDLNPQNGEPLGIPSLPHKGRVKILASKQMPSSLELLRYAT